MSFSRGGVVRVDDLILAIAKQATQSQHPELLPPSEAIQSLVTPNDEVERDSMTPMSNEPALRKVLEQAFQVASEQGRGGSPCISPACLAMAVLEMRAWMRLDQLIETCGLMGLIAPKRLTNRKKNSIANPPPIDRHSKKTPSLRSALDLWIALQHENDTTKSKDLHSELERVVRLIEKRS